MVRNKVFVSYAHKDTQWMKRLVKQLKVLERQNLIEVWADTEIRAGDDWYNTINKAMREARVAILMVTVEFLVSNFIQDEEVPALLQRHAEDGMRIVPILVYPCAWKVVPWLSQMQIRPKDGLPLARGNKYAWEKRLFEITEEIYELLSGDTKQNQTSSP